MSNWQAAAVVCCFCGVTLAPCLGAEDDGAMRGSGGTEALTHGASLPDVPLRGAERFSLPARSGRQAIAVAKAVGALQTADQTRAAEALAEQLMLRAMRVVREVREAREVHDARERAARAAERWDTAPQRAALDHDRAALIGVELSPLMTTMGSLESKRLATDSRWARVLVAQLAAHGVSSGSTVLASFSGSFPGLNIAVVAACLALDARLVAVSSVTASTWGADEPGLTWPEMEALVVRAGVLPAASVAISLGGTRDSGRDLSDEGRALAVEIQRSAASALGALVLRPETLADAIAQRLSTYRKVLGTTRPAVYVNVGGNHASLGGARADLRHQEGWILPLDEAERRIGTGFPPGASVVTEWLAEGVPVLNLLDVKTLARAWGLE